MYVKNENYPSKILDISNIQMNSDVSIITNQTEDHFEIIDVYCKGPRYNQPYIFTPFATWNESIGMEITHIFPTLYSPQYRGDLSNLTLKGVTTMNLPKVFPHQVDDILSKPGYDEGVSVMTKYHYALNKILMSKYFFNVTYRITRAWAGRIKDTFRLGLLGTVKRNEVDIVATGAIRRMSRFDEFDSIQESYRFT